MILAAERGRPGDRYILGGDNVTLERILRMLEGIIGRERMKFPVPRALALIAGIASEWVATHLTHRMPVATQEGVRMALRSVPFDRQGRRGLVYPGRRRAVKEAAAWR